MPANTHTKSPASVLAFITLGSNIQPETHLIRAVEHIATRLDVVRLSRVYETAPLRADGQIAAEQDSFLNAAVLVQTDLAPVSLKFDVLRAIEAALGRVRTADKFAPRTIDLDLALYGDPGSSVVMQHDDPRLTLPDPDILTRAHVARPLADLAPDYPHPLTGDSLSVIAARFGDQEQITVRRDITLSL
ncbi:MAG: 2-amino-4-hydroxy-6-hydroxymethyldihydropteridine diphosphokinase [Anaerolineae bacterium]|nr:2-amino-4-hydroxy-6-hydroxymethyldihydropteridine diphosphokinase [Anaerolineae bacterium]